MFTGFSLFLPAGLSTYTLTSYLLGILNSCSELGRPPRGCYGLSATVVDLG